MTSANLTQDSHNDEVIRLENVSVRYEIPNQRFRSFKAYVINRLQGKVRFKSHLALQGIDLSVRRGEVFGLIGRNGAGKSTLLKVVARVMKPTEGRVWVKGQIYPILGIGAGFHRELTGRENIFLNGTLLGFTRQEMEEKFNSIVEFADLGKFIDAPLRTYSTGMRTRLGFAVATDSKPDILILDEVLSVGDEEFRKKSTARMREFFEQGTTILLVSHNLTTIRTLCHRAAWIHKGEIRRLDEATSVVKSYRAFRLK
jgi:ABC-type polysaccharide/polyol phosphate transport system ATPase subunit